MESQIPVPGVRSRQVTDSRLQPRPRHLRSLFLDSGADRLLMGTPQPRPWCLRSLFLAGLGMRAHSDHGLDMRGDTPGASNLNLRLVWGMSL